MICPVDPYVDESYFRYVERIYEAAERGEKNLVLMSIEPSYPSEKYGYIKPVLDEDGNRGFAFTEKPTAEKAREYIEAGALWNGCVFGFKKGKQS